MGLVWSKVYDWWYEIPIVLVEKPRKICLTCKQHIQEHAVREYTAQGDHYWCSIDCYQKRKSN